MDVIARVKSITLNLSDGRTIDMDPYVKPNAFIDFDFLCQPIKFCDFVEWQEDFVHLYSIQRGFCGVFSWDGCEITSIDNNNYNKEMKVLAYKYFDTKTGERELAILVDDN